MRQRRLMSQPWSMKSRASQSSSSGWVGRCALLPEVFGRGDEAAAEEIRPQPVDEHAGSERMVRIGQPLGQPQAIARRVFREWNQEFGERVAADAVGVGLRRIVAAPREDVSWPRLRAVPPSPGFLGSALRLRRVRGGRREVLVVALRASSSMAEK